MKNKMMDITKFMQYQRDLDKSKRLLKVILSQQPKAFKIGKTGKNTEERFQQPDYNNVYDNIYPVYTSTDAEIVSRMEVDLIKEFKDDSRCDNERDTIEDKMEMSGQYTVYVVWKH